MSAIFDGRIGTEAITDGLPRASISPDLGRLEFMIRLLMLDYATLCGPGPISSQSPYSGVRFPKFASASLGFVGQLEPRKDGECDLSRREPSKFLTIGSLIWHPLNGWERCKPAEFPRLKFINTSEWDRECKQLTGSSRNRKSMSSFAELQSFCPSRSPLEATVVVAVLPSWLPVANISTGWLEIHVKDNPYPAVSGVKPRCGREEVWKLCSIFRRSDIPRGPGTVRNSGLVTVTPTWLQFFLDAALISGFAQFGHAPASAPSASVSSAFRFQC